MNLKRIRLAAALLITSVLPALAGDAATFHSLGFSADHSVYAFEQFGTQDGSGFPYAERFYIDTATDGFLPNTPVRVLLQDDNAAIDDARIEARDKGERESGISDATLGKNPGDVLVFNPLTEIDAPGFSARFTDLATFPPVALPRTVDLNVTLEPPAANCYGMAVAQARFKLALIKGDEVRVLHEDATVPASRNCPVAYRIAGIIRTPHGAPNPVLVVLLHVESIGFEGPDHRFLAITARD